MTTLIVKTHIIYARSYTREWLYLNDELIAQGEDLGRRFTELLSDYSGLKLDFRFESMFFDDDQLESILAKNRNKFPHRASELKQLSK